MGESPTNHQRREGSREARAAYVVLEVQTMMYLNTIFSFSSQ